MEIQSAFNAGVQGFQQAKENANQAAADIVASTTIESESNQTTSTEVTSEVTSQVATKTDAPELNQAIVDLKVAEYQAKSSAEVIKTADETLGTLLDVTA
ncbi:hypothetical protein [Litorilituus lipolyticus]|uniref:Flagellar biosynthesis protein FlgE n=1 Tax=Litorilituus lipolyticus TaxID=2491017 RepID=A0A502KNZ2_9GAMM|nr:hypothetical protein [Litorilituus lipolyticus]TPH13358.1 hypothetical protein EPA86_14300 [Litorilituus lipolyticus]